MAMGKNKTGIMAAITAATETSKDGASDRAHRTLPKGTIGSVRAGLGGIQDIDTNLILAWGPKDRLGIELTAVNSTHELAVQQDICRRLGVAPNRSDNGPSTEN